MDNYNLNPNETVLVDIDHTTIENGKFFQQTGNLALTNQHLIWAVKSSLGKVKELRKFPLSALKTYEGRAQVQLDEKFGEPAKLRFYFVNEQLSFHTDEKKKARELVNTANKLITGTQEDVVAKSVIPGTAAVAESIKGTVSTVKNIFGIKQAQVSMDCPSCGASISGPRGQVVPCPYCGRNQKLS